MPQAKRKQTKAPTQKESPVTNVDAEEEKRPPYPKQRNCHCSGEGAEPEWEWEFGDTWCCLGCGIAIRVAQETPAKKTSVPRGQSQESIQRLQKLKRGDKFAYKNSGFGHVTYEKGDEVIGRKKGKLLTRSFDTEGLTWTGTTWKFDAGLGLVTTIVLLEDVPPGGLKE